MFSQCDPGWKINMLMFSLVCEPGWKISMLSSARSCDQHPFYRRNMRQNERSCEQNQAKVDELRQCGHLGGGEVAPQIFWKTIVFCSITMEVYDVILPEQQACPPPQYLPKCPPLSCVYYYPFPSYKYFIEVEPASNDLPPECLFQKGFQTSEL